MILLVYALWMAAEFLSSPDVYDSPGLDQVDDGSTLLMGCTEARQSASANQPNQPGC